MNERDSRIEKYLDEFVLVKNDGNPILRETDVTVRPIAIGKNGPEFEILDKDNNRIGIVKEDKTFVFDKQYQAELKEQLKEFYEKIGFEEDNLKYDVIKELQKQDEKEKNNENERQNNTQNTKEINSDTSKNNNPEKNDSKEKRLSITKEEIEENFENGDNKIQVNAFTIIKDDNILNKLGLPTSADRNTVSIAEIDDADKSYKLLYREVGTNEIKEIEPVADGYEPNCTEEVIRYRDGQSYTESMQGTRLQVSQNKESELCIRNIYGQLNIESVDRQDNGDVVLTDVETDIGYPTEIDLKAKEIDERISQIRNEVVRNMVKERVEEQGIENIYLDDLERIIEECDREYAELNHEPSREPRLGN